MGNAGRWILGVFVRCHHFNNNECRTLGAGGGPLTVGQGCPMGCAPPNYVQPFPPTCRLLPELDAWKNGARKLTAEKYDAFLSDVEAVLPALARELGFDSVEALKEHARAAVPAGGCSRAEAMAALVADIAAVHDTEVARIPPGSLNSATAPEEVPAPRRT